MFVNNEVICLNDLNNYEIKNVLKIYTKSIRAFFIFKICGLGITFNGDDDGCLIDEGHWVKTVWPLLSTKVISLEFFNTVEFIDGILPAILNGTDKLKLLKIHNFQYSPIDELYKVKRLQSLEQLTLNNCQVENINKNKLLGIIPKQLRKICLKSMWGSQFIIEDITRVLSYCSLYLETLELISIDVTPELMQSIAGLDMKLKKFCLILAECMHYEHEPEMLCPLFNTKWPLISLTLRADCLTNKHLCTIANTFKNLENLSLSSDTSTNNVTEDGINALGSLKNLKTIYIGFGKAYRAYGAFY